MYIIIVSLIVKIDYVFKIVLKIRTFLGLYEKYKYISMIRI